MQEIRPLTSLRGFAALAIVMQHFSISAQTLTPHWIPSLVPHGYMAVDFFFVLSGFIMSLTYLASFQAEGIRAFPAFLFKRVARIVPLNLFVLLMLMVLGLLSHVTIGRNIFFNHASLAFDLPANMLMLQGLGIGTNLNGPSWSISTEFAAYLLFPVFIMCVCNRWLSAATLLLALGVVVERAFRSPGLYLSNDSIQDQILSCFTEFILGMGAYILYRHRRENGKGSGDVETGALYAGVAIGLLSGTDLIDVLLFPFLIVSTALNRGVFSRWLSGGVPYFLGLVSFSIYLIHEPCRRLAVLLFTTAHPAPISPLSALLFALVGSLTVVPPAWLTYTWIERPGREALRRWAEIVARRRAAPRKLV